jgi:oxalate decarboxylase/phosphoglucose isomerase-like protein (cupin superfamily)
MAEATEAVEVTAEQIIANKEAQFGYETWIKSVGVPIHEGYFLEDLRNIELGWWEDRKCNAAFLQLEGQQGVAEARITEIPAGATLPPLKFALDDVVYVLEGRGFCTVSSDDGKSTRTFEWQKHSLFLLPRNHTHQLSNAQGDQPARLLHNNYLPVSMVGVPDPDFFFNNDSASGTQRLVGDFYSEAKTHNSPLANGRVRAQWMGNFFPDMRAWDKLVPFYGRGAGGTTVFIEFPDSPMTCHMSVFDAGTYKKGHRHGPGFVIVIPKGEGYSIMWPEGGEKVIVPWHEGSVFVPPARWWHQHFNVGTEPARYLALHPPRQFSGTGERIQNPADNQIEYPQEELFIREKFAKELDARGGKSLMPEQAYEDMAFEWDYGEA